MLGGIDELKSVPQSLGLGRRERLVQRPRPVCIEVVDDQCDLGGLLITLCDCVVRFRCAISWINDVQSGLLLCSVIFTMRWPESGSLAMKMLQVPQRSYS